MERDEYLEVLVDFLELLPPTMVVERISGEAPASYFVGPSWCLDKNDVRRALDAEFVAARHLAGQALGTGSPALLKRDREGASGLQRPGRRGRSR
jgi:radical SAM superfamily enzyme